MTAIPLGGVSDSKPSGVSLSEVISALSFALDLTEGAVPGHALRSCLLGMRIAKRAGLPGQQLDSLYYALLLKDVGCSSNAARMCQIIGGDDRAVKAGVRLEDWTKPHKPQASTFRLLWKHVLPEATPVEKAIRIGKIALTQHRNNREMISLRCDRGAAILRELGMTGEAADAVRYLDEHWNGAGYPERRRKENIPLLARICQIAQNLDVFASERGTEAAVGVLQDRSGRWFDPELVKIAMALHQEGSLWQRCYSRESHPEETRSAVTALAPEEMELASSKLDDICVAFAAVIDAKSPFTYRHSIGVAEAAVGIADVLGLSQERRELLWRSALLHDLGKLGVSNAILDKQGKLTAEEWSAMQTHPGLTRSVLERVSAFRQLAMVAGEHHERLDGSGYPNGTSGHRLSLESRILAVADVYGALAEDRPYRERLNLDQIIAIMGKDVPRKLDTDCFKAVIRYAAAIEKGQPEAERASAPAQVALPMPA